MGLTSWPVPLKLFPDVRSPPAPFSPPPPNNLHDQSVLPRGRLSPPLLPHPQVIYCSFAPTQPLLPPCLSISHPPTKVTQSSPCNSRHAPSHLITLSRYSTHTFLSHPRYQSLSVTCTHSQRTSVFLSVIPPQLLTMASVLHTLKGMDFFPAQRPTTLDGSYHRDDPCTSYTFKCA